MERGRKGTGSLRIAAKVSLNGLCLSSWGSGTGMNWFCAGGLAPHSCLWTWCHQLVTSVMQNNLWLLHGDLCWGTERKTGLQTDAVLQFFFQILSESNLVIRLCKILTLYLTKFTFFSWLFYVFCYLFCLEKDGFPSGTPTVSVFTGFWLFCGAYKFRPSALGISWILKC